jgi:hypothetical protein
MFGIRTQMLLNTSVQKRAITSAKNGRSALHSPGTIFVGQYITLYGPVIDFRGNILDPKTPQRRGAAPLE